MSVNPDTCRNTTLGNTRSPSTRNLDQSLQSPGSDWVDIDGIIRSFLQETDSRGARLPDHQADNISAPVPGGAWMAEQQNNPPRPSIIGGNVIVAGQCSLRSHNAANVIPQPEAAGGAYHGQHGWGRSSTESVSLEDPLFDFNGSAMDNFPFATW
ncbi:uncharacterized protein BDV17DRAFT_293116 [Aspergillus undulatus]|uniref:uncharacterized protein n=1 Tax=Aspergillus undulatus TaxID=1810928 RepID=UPI003CCCA35A